MNIPNGYVSSSEARKHLRVSSNTLRLWANNGNIEVFRGGQKGTHRYYNIKKFIESNSSKDESIIQTQEIEIQRKKICYCRVSTAGQKDDLRRQVEYLKFRFPEYEFITDIGSGINFKRKGFKTILEYAIKGNLEVIVVAHKDRLCRFGFDLVEWIISEFSNGKILVLEQTDSSPEQELVNDVLSIINVFSAKINGSRKYKKRRIEISESKEEEKTN